MLKKLVSLGLAGVLLLLLGVPGVFAEESTDPGALSKEQEEKLIELHSQILDLRKELLDRQVEAGLITEAQAELAKKRMELQQEYLEANGISPVFQCTYGYANGFGMRSGVMGAGRVHGHGRMRGMGGRMGMMGFGMGW